MVHPIQYRSKVFILLLSNVSILSKIRKDSFLFLSIAVEENYQGYWKERTVWVKKCKLL